MASYTSRKIDGAERRREAVARLRLRGLSVRSIATALASLDPPVLNREGKPWGKTTIQSDLDVLRERWREDSSRTIAEHHAEQLAQLREVQREAWRDRNLELVLKTHDRIARILGTDAPARVEATVAATAIPHEELTPEKRRAMADILLGVSASDRLPGEEADL